MLLNQPWLGNQRILLLEPRRLAARAVASRMADTLGEQVGATVGYRTRFDTRVGPDTRIEVITDGVLLRMLLQDPSLATVGAVLFDEFHERAIGADTGAALLLEVQESLRPDLRLLLMSATLPGQRLRDWLPQAVWLESAGRSYPVTVEYRPVPVRRQWLDHLADCLVEALPGHAGSVLAFLPGRGEIAAVQRRLQQRLPDDVVVLPLHGSVPPAAQRQAINADPHGRRRLVLATAVAESALTLEGVSLVVDAGWQRLSAFDAGAGMGRLVTRRLSRASADQRAGRAGRQGPGRCLRLWPADEVLAEQTPVQIANADLMPLVLDLAAWGCRDPDQLAWLEPPPARHWAQARDVLQALGLLDRAGALTELGRSCQQHPLHPRLARMVCAAAETQCSHLAIKLALMLENPLPGAYPEDIDPLSRLRWFSGTNDDARSASLQQQYRQLSRKLGPDCASAEACVGDLLLAAFPDRLARRRDDSDQRYLLRNGRGARLPQAAASPADWLVVADADGDNREMRIRLAAAPGATRVDQLVGQQGRWQARLEWSADGRQFRSRRQRMLDAISVEDTAAPADDQAELSAAVLAHVATHLDSLPWTPTLRQWQARTQRMHDLLGGDWPDVSDAALCANVADWLAGFLAPALSARNLAAIPLHAALHGMLSYAQQQQLDQWLPAELTVPSGRSVALDYCVAGAPVLEVKLQEMFGQTSSPTLANGQLTVLLHLLSPARRPLAVTTDLTSFWRQAYADVRKQMRGRYPKHPWPEDPLAARPQAGISSSRKPR